MKFNLTLRKFVVLFCLCFATIRAQADDHDFTITVRPNQALSGYKAFLFYKTGPGKFIIDSADFVDDKFVLKGNVLFIQKAVMYIEPANTNFGRGLNTKPGMSIYLENGNILMSGKPTYETVRRSGTPLNNDYQEFLDLLHPFAQIETDFADKNRVALQNKDTLAIRRLETEYFEMGKNKRQAEEKYFNAHLGSLVAFEWLQKNINIQQEKLNGLALFEKMSEKLKNSDQGKAYFEKLRAIQSVEIGSEAPDLTAKTEKGDDVSLKSYRGKYVLLDFWASWCLPCRRENPNVLKAYQKYNQKGFNVFAFSLDSAKDAWVKAIAQDGLPWMQVSDLNGFYSPIAGLYGIQSIPSNLLIDPNGKIIARDLRGEALEKALSKVL